MTHPLPRLLRALLLPLLLAGTAHAELASHTSFKGEVTAYTYDVMGREVMRTFADGQQVRTTYTATGQVASVTDARGTTTYAYDARDRVIRIDYPDGQWLAYAWDGNGNRTSLSTPTGTTTYAYDDSNRLVQVTDPAGQVTTYAWDEAGNPTGQTLPNGVATYRIYDDNSQLEAVRHEKDGQVLARYTYTRDEDGRRTGATEVQLDPASGALHPRTLAWTYDELGRLASETLTESGHTTTTAWTHDEVGNRLSEARFREGVLLATDRYSYDANDRLTRAWTENGAGGTVSETLYTYDANGATTEVVRTGGFSRIYIYDAAQRLVGVSDSTGQRITYGYDAQGNRVTQVVQQSPELALNGSWRYLLDPLAPFTEVVATLTDAGQAETEYRFGAGRIAELTAGQLLYYGEDGHHSVRLVTDAQGQVVAHLNYAAFGQAAASVTDDAGGNPAASPAFRYTGQQWDGALGEYYLRARTYDPGVGRFTQRDSWQGNSLRPVTLNAYVYADADPVGSRDPSGFFSTSESIAVSNNIGLQAGIGAARVVVKPYASRQLSRSLLRSQSFLLTGGSLVSILVQACYASPSSCLFDIPVLVTGREMPSTAIHIASSQIGFGSTKSGDYRLLPFLLNRSSRSAVAYNSQPQCNPAARMAYGQPGTCDEYPFASTTQGGQINYENDMVSLRLVPRAEQTPQRDLLLWFYSSAGRISPDGASPASAFISIAIPFLPSFAIDRNGLVRVWGR